MDSIARKAARKRGSWDNCEPHESSLEGETCRPVRASGARLAEPRLPAEQREPLQWPFLKRCVSWVLLRASLHLPLPSHGCREALAKEPLQIRESGGAFCGSTLQIIHFTGAPRSEAGAVFHWSRQDFTPRRIGFCCATRRSERISEGPGIAGVVEFDARCHSPLQSVATAGSRGARSRTKALLRKLAWRRQRLDCVATREREGITTRA